MLRPTTAGRDAQSRRALHFRAKTEQERLEWSRRLVLATLACALLSIVAVGGQVHNIDFRQPPCPGYYTVSDDT